jgi:hypothetical protein
MKVSLALFALIFSAYAISAEPTVKENKKVMNSEQKMEERHDNASVLTGSNKAYPGSEVKDTRPQGKVNQDDSDQDLKKKK